MVEVYCDESHDGTTYALGGWVATPSGWATFSPRWRAMLDQLKTPDSSTLSAFHASEIVNRELISKCRVKGWTFEDEKHAFSRALDVIEDRTLCANLFAVGCAIALPSDAYWVDTKDTIWYLLFTRFFTMLVQQFPAFNGFSLIFDAKPEVKKLVDDFYVSALEMSERITTGKFAAPTVAFADDETAVPLQAADLLMYEWRRSLSEAITQPAKRQRRSYVRLRSVCAAHSELHYVGPDIVQSAMESAGGDASNLARTLLTCPATRT